MVTKRHAQKLKAPPARVAHYEWIRAIVHAGTLRWEYKIDRRGAPIGRMSHDEDVSDWSESDITKLTRSVLFAQQDPVEIEIVRD